MPFIPKKAIRIMSTVPTYLLIIEINQQFPLIYLIYHYSFSLNLQSILPGTRENSSVTFHVNRWHDVLFSIKLYAELRNLRDEWSKLTCEWDGGIQWGDCVKENGEIRFCQNVKWVKSPNKRWVAKSAIWSCRYVAVI